MLVAAMGITVMVELFAKMNNIPVDRITDTNEWLNMYSEKWREKNKESELYRIQDRF